jgi:hypothetical protein
MSKYPIYIEGIHAFLPRYFYNPFQKDYRAIIDTQLSTTPPEKGGDLQRANVETKMLQKLPEVSTTSDLSKTIVDISDPKQLENLPPTFLLLEDKTLQGTSKIWEEVKKKKRSAIPLWAGEIPYVGPVEFWKISTQRAHD